MEIINSTAEDISSIFRLYDEGTAYQKSVAKKHWQGFDRAVIETEIREGRQWKIMAGDEIACVFAIAFNDPLIWQEKDKDPAIYIHRIATNPLFRGRGYVKHIVAWAKEYARAKGKDFIRMDTGSGNEKLNNYYSSCGFTYLGITEIRDAGNLPAHYKAGSSSLFELPV
ncbi:MAG TPA: GNAT family N-acetyltransferase [Puia sp.]|nr:GNAT family N-acetyltransferase [Puia sp.]